MYRVLALTGFDRSGTTFLGRYIQQRLTRTFFAGELDKGIEGLVGGRHMKCSCGKLLPDCEFWSPIRSRVVSAKHDPSQLLTTICDTIFAACQPDLIVDSSKSLKHIGNLTDSFQGKNVLLHVVRNPKGIAFSRMKTRIERVKRGKHPNPGVASMYNMMMVYDSFAWSLSNIYIELFLRFKTHQYHKLIYEKTEAQLPLFLGKYFGESLDAAGQVFLNNHVIFGNMNRFGESGAIRIDDSWKQNLQTHQKFIIDLITLPVRLIFRYRF